MDKKNVLFMTQFVNTRVKETSDVDTSKIVAEFKVELLKKSDKDFIETMISCFIPDLYKDNGKREKIYTKLAEVLIGEWWRRMGGTFNLPTKKSGTEDVEIILNSKSVVCDAKIFRLGRSQKAPNVKDFLKLASVRMWMNNLVKRYKDKGKVQEVVGGMITYSSLHEWEGSSEVYEECTNKETPVIMLPYEVLAVLLDNKSTFKLNEFLMLWNYETHFKISSRSKEHYWNTIDRLVSNLINLSLKDYRKLISDYRKEILESVKIYSELIDRQIDMTDKAVREKVDSFNDINTLREYTFKYISEGLNKKNKEYKDRIKKFRKY